MNHDNLAAGYLGQRGILASVGQEFTWPGISNIIHQYVEGCVTCQSTKNDIYPTMVPLQPIEILDRPFGTITMDFITNLPESNGYDLLGPCPNTCFARDRKGLSSGTLVTQTQTLTLTHNQ